MYAYKYYESLVLSVYHYKYHSAIYFVLHVIIADKDFKILKILN